MTRNLGKLLLALCLLTVGSGIANAQIDTGVTIRADVPYTFIVGDTTLAAGKYEIRALDDMPGVLELRSVSGHAVVNVDAESVLTKDEKIASKCELVFDKVGDRYFLSQVFVEGSSSGSELAKSRMEKRLEGDGGRPERHSVAAMLRRLKP
jgi:hypothetical protein